MKLWRDSRWTKRNTTANKQWNSGRSRTAHRTTPRGKACSRTLLRASRWPLHSIKARATSAKHPSIWEDTMGSYEFRTLSHGKTIWTVEHYCQNNRDALDQAAKAVKEFEVTVWHDDHLVTGECDATLHTAFNSHSIYSRSSSAPTKLRRFSARPLSAAIIRFQRLHSRSGQ
jgi:hypothetical protein